MKRFYRLLSLAICAFLVNVSLLAQNNCATAIAVGALPYSTPAHTTAFPPLSTNKGFTTCGKVNDYNSSVKCGGTAQTSEDAVFAFTPSPGDECVTITLSGTGLGSAPNLLATASLSVLDGCPDNATTNCVSQLLNTGMASLVITNLVLNAGRTYYIVIDGSGACFGYRLNIAKGACPPIPPTGGPGTDCGNPLEVSFPYENVHGSTAGMANNYPVGTACIDAGNAGEDIVYHFSVAAPTCIRYNAANMSRSGTLYLMSGCPGQAGTNCIRTSECQEPDCSGNIVEEMTIPAGDYFIILKGNSVIAALEFDLTIDIGNVDNNVVCETCNDVENCVPCKNVGFEKLSFDGWVATTGSYANPKLTPGLNTGALNLNTTRHTLVTRGHVDYAVGPALTVVPPTGKDYAIRLGNYLFDQNKQVAGDAETISYTFVVDSTNTNFVYYYAIVLEDNGHPESQQPYFGIDIKTSSGRTITCGNYEVRAGAGIPGFKDAPALNTVPIRWKDWTAVNIPLLDFIGESVTVTFTTKDCSQDGHFGYAYLDAECQPLIIQRDSNLLCNPDTVHLSAPSGFAGYLWSTGETTQSIDASKKGVYTVTCRTVTNCEVRLAIEILYEKPPIPNFTWKYECKDSTMTFTDASQELEGNKITKWKWYFGDGDSSSVKNPVHKYTYSDSMKVVLILETAGGCSADTMIIVPVDVYMPQGPINALDTIKLCEKQTLNLYADSIPLSKYEWKGPSGFGSTQIKPVKVNILPKDSGWYRVKVDIRDGCKILNDSTWVVVEPLKIPFITPDTIICQGDTAKLYCGGGKTYLWTPSDSLSSTTAPLIRAWPDQTTMYTVNMFNDLCPDEVRQVEVRVLSGVVSMQMPDTLRSCIGGSIQLQASVNGFDVFRWNGPNGYQSTQNLPLITGMNTSKTGYYKLNCSISNNICLTGSDSTYLDLYPDPVVTISPRPAVICAGDSIQLTATGAVSYVWTPNQFISRPNISNPWFKPPASRKYTVEGTSIDGCLGYDTITIRVNPLPAPNLGPDKYFCLGDTGYVKIAGTYDSVLWFNGVTIDSVMVTTDTTVSITVYRNGCVGYDTMRVFFQDPGLFTLGPDTLLCETQAYYTNIQLNSVDSTLWNDGDKNLNRNIDSAGTYSVIIWAGQCIYRDTIVVLFDSIPVFSLGPDQTVCTGTSVTLSAIPVPAHGLPMTYSWSTGPANTGPSITVNATGNYSATINSSRCTYTDNVVVTVVVPQIPQPGPDQSICRGDSATFVSEVTGDAYVWNTSATTQSITVKNAATYIVSIAIGPCVVRDTFQLHVQIPTPINLGPDSTLCENERMLIIGPLNFDTYSWSSGESTRNIRVSESGLYTLTAVKGLCTSTDDIRITFDTIPHFTIENDSICENSTAVFTAPLTGDAYLWSTGDITPSITVSQADNYWLTITNGKCTFTDTAELVVERAPALNIGNDSIVCVGTGVRYGHFIPAARYLWNTEGQDTTPYIDAKGDKSNLYSVVVKYRFCEMRDSVRLVVTQMPQPDLGPDRLICEGTSVNLFANTFGERFDWNTPIVNGSSATVSEAGMYKVIITNGRCENSDSVVVRVQPKHEVILPPDIQICSNEKYDIVPVTDCQAPIYEWSNGGSGESITVRKSGTYTLKVSNGVCEAIDEIVVTVVPLPDVEPINTVLCPEDSLPLDLPAAYKYYHQSDMSPFTATNLYPQMEYNLFIIDSNGCRWTTHFWAELNMDCDRSIYIPNSFTPNGDGKNDLFKVEINDLKFVEMRIFDRWGREIFQTSMVERGWNGKYKDEICKSDIYQWKVIYEDAYHKPRTKFGHVNLLR